MSTSSIVNTVQEQYAAVARSGLSNDSTGVRLVARAFGYSDAELASLPPEANMGLSCGNPTALAALQPGEVVVDLGCGGGLDVLLAAERVGLTGKVIGIDMTPKMLARARAGAAQVGATNVEFHLAQIDALPLPDASVDCVISNCVINLAPDKSRVFREILRVLKPGGRLAVSDIALKRALPPELAADVQAYVGCIAGAMLLSDYERALREAGFAGVAVVDSGADLNVYAQAGATACSPATGGCCGPAADSASGKSIVHEGLSDVLRSLDVNAYAASVRVYAVKESVMSGSRPGISELPWATLPLSTEATCCSPGCCAPAATHSET